MKSILNKSAVGSLLLTLSVAGSLSAANRDDAEERRERVREAREERREQDDASARARWMEQWYNEGYRATTGKTDANARFHGIWSQSYQRFMMEAAKRERLRYAAKMPNSASSAMVIDPNAPIRAKAADSATRDLRWTNIGPAKATFARNGGTLNVTDSGRVNAIVTSPSSPNTIYVAVSGGGLWKSTDGGAFWQAKTETLGTLSVGTVEMDPNDPNVLYLGLGDFSDGTGLGVVKMTGGGDYWEEPVLLGDSTSIRDIKVAPSNSNIVLVATNAGLYRSTDAGKSYAQVTLTGISSGSTIWNIAPTGGNNFVMSLQLPPGTTGSEGQVWRSTDNGATWTQTNGITHPNGVNRISLASAPSNRSVVYAMARKPPTDAATRPDLDLASLYKSTDGGQNWTDIGRLADGSYKAYTNPNADQTNLEDLLNGQGWYNHAIVVSPTNPNVAYFGGSLIATVTRDGGNSFGVLTDWLGDFGMPYVHADFHAAHIASNGTLYFGTDGGIFMSTNAGTSFTATLNEGIVSHLVYHACSTPASANLVLAGLQDNGTRIRETNTSTFDQIIGGDGFGCQISPTNASVMLGSLYYDRIQKSTDGGNTFTQTCTGITECGKKDGTAPFHTLIKAWSGDATGNIVYTASSKLLYRSTNFAGSWTAVGSSGLPTDDQFVIRGFGIAKTSGTSPNNDSVLGIAASGGRIYLSNDGGTTWTKAATPSNNGLSMSSIAFDPVDRNIIYISSVAPDASRTHLWRSTNFGASWAAIDVTGFPIGVPVNSITVDPVVRTTLYAATHLGAYRSLDSGSTWERLGSFLPLVNVTDITVSADGNQVRAATFGRGIWELGTIGANVAPTANFTSSKAGKTATFTDTSTDSDGTIVRRQWNFGDGVNSLVTNPQHTYAATGTYTVTLTVTDNAGYTNTKTAQVVIDGTGGTRRVRNDINGDGKSDLLWRSNGNVAYWAMNGGTVSTTGYIGNVGVGYNVVAGGDFNGDGVVDLAWSNGNNLIISINNGSGTFTNAGSYFYGPTWQPYAAVDINNDGKDDILWRQGSLIAHWLMNGGTVSGTAFTGDAGTGFSLAAAGDLNGDGAADLALSNGGLIKFWINNGTGGFTSSGTTPYGGGWQPFASLDFNGDGRSDIMWRLNSSIAYWLMNGSTVSSSAFAGDAGAGYSLVASGDFNGDGIGDLIFANGNQMKAWTGAIGGIGSFAAPNFYGPAWQPFDPSLPSN